MGQRAKQSRVPSRLRPRKKGSAVPDGILPENLRGQLILCVCRSTKDPVKRKKTDPQKFVRDSWMKCVYFFRRFPCGSRHPTLSDGTTKCILLFRCTYVRSSSKETALGGKSPNSSVLRIIYVVVVHRLRAERSSQVVCVRCSAKSIATPRNVEKRVQSLEFLLINNVVLVPLSSPANVQRAVLGCTVYETHSQTGRPLSLSFSLQSTKNLINQSLRKRGVLRRSPEFA